VPKSFLFLACFLTTFSWGSDSWDRIQQTGEIRWGADATGGAPYIFPDPANPRRLIGFEVDLMRALAREMGVKERLVQVPWEELVPALMRDNFDMAFCGLEVTPERQQVIDFTRPYYYFSEQLTVRRGEEHLGTLEALQGRRVGTLAASLAFNILARDPRIKPVTYPSPVEAYHDLEIGRVDAVLMDLPISAWYAGPNKNLHNIEKTVEESTYAGGIRKGSPILKEKLDTAILALVKSGEIETIYRKWNLWTPQQSKLLSSPAGVGGGSVDEPRPTAAGVTVETGSWKRFIPLMIRGAGMTILIACLSMALAILLGFALCYATTYGNRAVQLAATSYIEIIRGTPLLIQLYLLYYGLPNIGIELNAFVAAVLGMGMNYAAYEAEIYRAGILAVPKGQTDAARSLGMTPNQSLWHIILPQAFRTILPPSTNDFIALFKDTSLVSIITVTELTKVYSTAATNTYRFLELGLVTAALYFAMSWPLSLWSRRLERKRHAAVH